MEETEAGRYYCCDSVLHTLEFRTPFGRTCKWEWPAESLDSENLHHAVDPAGERVTVSGRLLADNQCHIMLKEVRREKYAVLDSQSITIAMPFCPAWANPGSTRATLS